MKASARTDLNLSVLLVTLAERISRDLESATESSPTTENGDLERNEGEGGVESDVDVDVDDDKADVRDGVQSVDTDVDRDIEEDEARVGRGCRRRRFARLGTVSWSGRTLFLVVGPRTGDTTLRTQLPTLSSHCHSPAFSADI